MGRSTNTFRYVSFNDRISQITIDVIHRIRRVEDDQLRGTYFGECLNKWTGLDLTEQFTTFRLEISDQVQSYEQLVHHEAEIVEALKKHLAVHKSAALQALEELLVQLARDLQQDFIPHLPDFFSILVAKLKQEKDDPEVLESIFQTLALLFRMLWRFLVKDFKQLFGYFSELLMKEQKDYIKVFAAESCAYLLRKVKKKNELLNYLFKVLKSTPELADGVGLLLFEMLKGVKGHFSTVGVEVLPMILHKLGPWSPNGKKISLPRVEVEQAVTILMQDCADHGSKDTCAQFWPLLLDCTKQVHIACLDLQSQKDNDNNLKAYVNHLCRLLRMVSIWIYHKKGSIISDPDKIAEVLIAIAKSPCCPDILGPELLQTVSKLLRACSESLSSVLTQKLVVLSCDLPVALTEIQSFVLALIDLPFFEKDVLVSCIKRVDHDLQSKGEEVIDDLLAFITFVVLEKRSSPVTGDDLPVLKACSMDALYLRSSKTYPFADMVVSVIKKASSSSSFPEDLKTLWGSVVIAPHLRIRDLTATFVSLWKTLLTHLKEASGKQQRSDVLFVLNEVLKGILIRILPEKEEMPVDINDIYSILSVDPASPVILQIVDLFLSYPPCENLLTAERLADTYTILKENLTSHLHSVRLLTCHILSLFPVEMPDCGDDTTRDSIFQIFLEAERSIPQIDTYRDKLVQLRKLNFELVTKCLPVGNFEKAPLLFLLGNEFWNFKLLWDPLTDIIATYAYGINFDEFWSILGPQLRRAATESRKELQLTEDDDQDQLDDSLMDEDSTLLTALLSDHKTNFMKEERTADFPTYRVNLWKLMKKFPDKCSQKSDELCSLYLDFLKHEYREIGGDGRQHQNIMREVADETLDDEDELEETEEADMEVDENENDEDDEDAKMEEDASETPQKSASLPSLLIHLDLFGLFKKQHSMFLKEDVKQTFFDFLLDGAGSLQKAAFDVILTYKSAHITPYRDNFHRLLDDKTFKNELIFFKVDTESSTLKEEHREGLLPVLMRILYGKMRGKGVKSKSRVKTTLVLRFLGGCRHEEFKYFLHLLFRSFEKFYSDDPYAMVRGVMENIDLKKMMPLKKMKGVVKSIRTLTKQLGHRLDSSAHNILHILLGMAALITQALERRPEIIHGFVNSLKGLRQVVHNTIVEFFEGYDDLDFTESELKAVFEVLVWPRAEKFAEEGARHPTPLLKLLTAFSNSYRLLPLLGHTKEITIVNKDGVDGDVTTDSYSILGAAFTLLNAPKCKTTITRTILNIVQQLLLKYHEWEIDGAVDPLPGVFQLSQGEDGKFLGQSILLPEIPLLLKFLHAKLVKLLPKSRGSKKHQLNQEIRVLSRLSSIVTTPEQCHSLCGLLIPYLNHSSTLSEEVEENTLRSVINLIQYVEKPADFYRITCPLFGTVERRESRVLLCELFTSITSRAEHLPECAVLMKKLNAWDPKRVDEPDYTSRLEAFREITDGISKATAVDMDLIVPTVYNCDYFIRGVDDLSIRDSSTFCITTLIKKIAELDENSVKSELFLQVQAKIIIRMVKAGMRSKSEAVRHEYIAILQCLVTLYPTSYYFLGLSDLIHKESHKNFFENIRHIQIYQRCKGLRRLYHHLKFNTLSTDIHLSFFVPLIYSFITEAAFAKHENIQDAARDLLWIISTQLSWKGYSNVLEFYLNLLPKMGDGQKKVTRIIGALLCGFHFDLSQSTFQLRPKKKKKDEEIIESDKEDEDDDDDDAEKGVDGKSDKVDDVLPMDLGITEMDVQQVPEKKAAVEAGKEDAEKEDELMERRKVVMTLCSEENATKIHCTIVKKFLPKVMNAICQRSKRESEHKLVRSHHSDANEVLRVPLALAAIQLFQRLPKGTLEAKLPTVLLKICNFLRSREEKVRKTSRETLAKSAVSLGARFFPFILREIKGCLERGFQRHVLTYTTWYLLRNVESVFTPGDLDPSIGDIHTIFHNEMFDFLAEEKDVQAITTKHSEARASKGNDSYGILAKLISAAKLDFLIKPFRDLLTRTYRKRIADKANGVLKSIAPGLTSNTSIPLPAMMVFINSLTTKLIPDLMEVVQPKMDTDEPGQSRTPQSCLLLQKALPRGGAKPKASKKTNAHILVEFGLEILFTYLKNSSLQRSNQLHIQMLDPLIPAILVSLDDTHVKTNTNALQCLNRLLYFPLPTLDANMDKIAKSLFVVLKNYAGAVRAKGDNVELIAVAFKTMTVFVREAVSYKMTTEQIKVLLTYCEEDFYNYERQSTSFKLLKSILTRKINIPQLHEVMKKIFELSITSSAGDTRQQCRDIVTYYLMNYPHGNGLKEKLDFYIDHLQFELEVGRVSALEMMIHIFTTFPESRVKEFCRNFFRPLAMASYNDDSLKCRKLVIVALKLLLGKIDLKTRSSLFREVYKWMKSDDLRFRVMGCHVCGLFVDTEGSGFSERQKTIVPLLQEYMEPSRYSTKKGDENKTEEDVDQKDVCLLAVINLFLKIARELNVMRLPEFIHHMNLIWSHLSSHLLYPQFQVRVVSGQILGVMFSVWEPQEVASLQKPSDGEEKIDNSDGDQAEGENRLKENGLAEERVVNGDNDSESEEDMDVSTISEKGKKNKKKKKKEKPAKEESGTEYLLDNTIGKMKTLCTSLCLQMRTPEINDILATQVVKNLLYITRVAEAMENMELIQWVAKKITWEVTHEVTYKTKQKSRRTHTFKWVAAVGVTLSYNSVLSILPVVLPHLQRELAEKSPDSEEIKTLAQEVIELLKKKVGVQKFTSAYVDAQKAQQEKRDERKRKIAEAAVLNPSIYAQKKIQKSQKKEQAKKRKRYEKKTFNFVKKSKLSILNVNVEDSD